MLRAKYALPYQAVVEEVESPALRTPEDLKIRVAYAGICLDDLYFYAKDRSSLLWPGVGPVTGHEFSGVVIEVGEDAKKYGWKIGDRVSGSSWNFCGKCYYCKRGMENHCTSQEIVSVYRTEIVMNQKQVCRLPESVSLKSGVFTDPVMYCMFNDLQHTSHNAVPNVLVFGANTMALLIVQLARMQGAAEITVVEKNAKKRALALELGADHVIDPQKEDVVYYAGEYTQFHGYDMVYEMARTPKNLDVAIQVMGMRGILLISSLLDMHENLSIDLSELFIKSGMVKCFQLAPYMLMDAERILPRLKLEPMITNVLPFEQINKAFHQQMQDDSVEVLMEVTPEDQLLLL